MNPGRNLPSITTHLSKQVACQDQRDLLPVYWSHSASQSGRGGQGRPSRFGSHDMSLAPHNRSWFNVHVINGRVRRYSNQGIAWNYTVYKTTILESTRLRTHCDSNLGLPRMPMSPPLDRARTKWWWRGHGINRPRWLRFLGPGPPNEVYITVLQPCMYLGGSLSWRNTHPIPSPWRSTEAKTLWLKIIAQIEAEMKSALIAILAGLAAHRASAHATFQILYVDGVNYISLLSLWTGWSPRLTPLNGAQCARLPASNSPVTNVLSSDIACNAGSSSAAAKCPVKAGSTVTVEIHQQPNTKDCASEAIGGAHYGPVQVYLAKVSDATTAVGSSAGWFKIFADTWAKNAAGNSGDDDYWGTKDIATCCGTFSALDAPFTHRIRFIKYPNTSRD